MPILPEPKAAERFDFISVIMTPRKYSERDILSKPRFVPTSFKRSFLESFTATVISPEAPMARGKPKVGSLKCTLLSVPHFIAICSALFIK